MGSSIIVAIMYIRNQSVSEKKRRINEQIQKTFVEQGILKIQEAFSEYGTSAIFGINDVKVWAVRALKYGESESSLKEKIDQIKKRPIIVDLIQRKVLTIITDFIIIIEILYYTYTIMVFQIEDQSLDCTAVDPCSNCYRYNRLYAN